ncbi:MAG: S49 family peptidase, partial [Sphingosinicella sp.]|uniref:S49 family peptidase n=1 Tax=Sphingosinicella sp. TaxID=1917971 RepID=UPI004037D079
TEISGGASLRQASRRLAGALADPAVTAIVLEIDSPGGSVYGVEEFANEVFAARARKRIVAHANALAASAAYWIAAQAEQFSVTPSGEVGSIGVVAVHVDYSEALKAEGIKITYVHAGEFKVEGNPAEPLNDAAQAFIQQRVNEYYEMFLAAVARGRGVGKTTVRKDFGQGRVYGAEQAKAAGMVDRIEPLTELIRRLQPRSRANQAALAAHADIAEAILKAS